MTLTCRREGTRFHLAGFIGEGASFAAITAAGGAAILDLAGVTGINSIGAKLYCDFALGWGKMRVAYERCPVVLLDSFIMLPSLLGSEDNTAKILSFHGLYRCGTCLADHEPLIGTDRLRLKDRELLLPDQSCPKCGSLTECQIDPLDLLHLVDAGALIVPLA